MDRDHGLVRHVFRTHRGPFKCYVTQYGVERVSNFPEKKCYEDVRFIHISVTKGWVGGCRISRKKALRNT